jgi:polyisoprenyl-phosphate glycosyltransferase
MVNPQINIVVPLYNEEEMFSSLIERLDKLIENSNLTINVIMIDDGSTDHTAELMKELSLKKSHYSSVILSRNFGHQLALTAGLKYFNATDAVLIMDGDLQDPPELLEEFYKYYKDGYDVVYAVRENRKEHFLKKMAYKFFYRLLKKISYINIPIDSGDFSLISRRIVEELNQMPEESRFLRGMRSWIGFKQIGVAYQREKRLSGESKYTLKKLMTLAFTGVFNFSDYPIKFLVRVGLFLVSVSLVYLAYVLIKKYFFGSIPDGFTALISVVILFGGFQLFALGILGEYILRIFFQVKNRPLYIVKEVIQQQEIHSGKTTG